jgi:hypothetical protein
MPDPADDYQAYVERSRVDVDPELAALDVARTAWGFMHWSNEPYPQPPSAWDRNSTTLLGPGNSSRRG